MNEQKAPGAIEWTRPRLSSGEILRGYTWNPYSGCMHGCTWTMADGSVAECYAKTVAERVAGSAYPQGFEHEYKHEQRLSEPSRLKHRAGIFILSMGDLFGGWMQNEEIEKVLKVADDNPQHVFFTLTKNPHRMRHFDFPDNVWTGISAPPTEMQGRKIDQMKLTDRWLNDLWLTNSKIHWMSIEPLTIDIAPALERYSILEWAVIGAGSSGKTYFPPALDVFQNVQAELDRQSVKSFYKGNLKSLTEPHGLPWREEFPAWA